MLLKNVVSLSGIIIYLTGYVIPVANERKRVFKFTKVSTIQTVSTNFDTVDRPISTESISAISCAALLMQYGPFTSMEFYNQQSKCRSFHKEETVTSINNKMINGWTFYNAKILGMAYDKECRLDEYGREYRGNKSTTKTGIECMVWSGTYPTTAYIGCQLHLVAEEGPGIWNTNYCRNPDYTGGGPWCYTMDPAVKWESCGVPRCYCYN